MFRRLRELPETIEIVIDGTTASARPDETVAAVLLRTEPFTSRCSPITGQPRAPYCLMGVCFDCLAVIDGKSSQRTCMIPVRNGMRIERQRGPRDLSNA